MPALLAFISGCASIPPHVGELGPGVESLELVDTPFYPQEQYQCGPAALATVLGRSGVPVNLEELVDRVYLPGRQGSLQVEMLAAVRASGRIPYVTDGTLQTLMGELHAGRPVVVLQNLGVAVIPKWHYAVVVGIDTEREDVILRSGVDERRLTSIPTFLRTWRRGDYWGFVVLRPDELPAVVNRERYLEAVAAVEKAGRTVEATTAWNAALRAWPGDPVALFALGNNELAAGNNAAAGVHFGAILERDPSSVAARNNLAIALARQARFEEALNEIAVAIANNDDPALARELQDTATLVEALARARSSD